MAIDIDALVNAQYDRDLGAALAADAVTDEAERQRIIAAAAADAAATIKNALDADAAADAAAFKAKDDEIAALKKALADCQAGTPPVDPPPPPPPTGDFVWRGLQTPQLTEAWMKANTGPRVTLTAATSNNVTGTVTGKKFTGTVIPANGVVLKDCEIEVSNGFGIDGSGKNYTLDHCRIRCTGAGNRYQGVLGNFKATGCDVSGFEDGFRPTGGNWLMKGCFVHDLSSGSEVHNDGLQAFSGPGMIEQNYIKARDTSAVMVQSFTNSPASAPGGIIVRHNWLGGADLPLRIEAECKGKGCQAYENIIEKGHWGHADLAGADVKHGNIDAVSGASID